MAKPKLRFPEFTDDWEQRKLGELGAITTGSTPSTSIPDYYSDDGIVWVTPTDICENITFESARKLSDLGQQVGRVVPKNTILVTCIASIGKNTMLGNTGSFNQQINGLTPNENECDPYFLLTESALWSAKMKSSAAAGTMQIVNRTEFSELKTWLPSLIEQQAISDFFRQLDNLITLQQREVEALEKQKKAVMQKIFSQQIRFKKDDGTDYPEWEEKRIGDCGEFYGGLSGKSKNDFGHGEEQYITYMNVYNNTFASNSVLELVDISDGRKQNNVEYGDVFFTQSSETADEVGMSSVWLYETTPLLNSFCMGYRPYDLSYTSPMYLGYVFRSREVRKQIKVQGQGISRINLASSRLSNVTFVLPCLEEQQKIADLLSEMDNAIDLAKQELEKWKLLKKGLLQQMFV